MLLRATMELHDGAHEQARRRPAHRRRRDEQAPLGQDLQRRTACSGRRRDQQGQVKMDLGAGERSGKIVAELLEVSKAYGSKQIVCNFSATIMRGDKVGLIGMNGAGKTTLIHQISGALPPDEGRIVFDGADLTHTAMHQRARLGLVRSYQITSVFTRLTVQDNLALAIQAGEGTSFKFWRAARSDHTRYAHAAEVAERVRMLRFHGSRDKQTFELVGTNSRLDAIQAAHEREMVVIGLTGHGGGKMAHLLGDTDVHVCVPHDRPARILEVQILALHCMCDAVDTQLLGEQEEPTP